MGTTIIKKVENNKAKGNTFEKLFDRYKKAYESKFYLECLVLIYAMFEDRFNEVLIHLDIAAYSDKGLAILQDYQEEIYTILNSNNNKKKIEIVNTISAKYKIIKKLSNETIACSNLLKKQKEAILKADQNTKLRKNGKQSKKIKLLISDIEIWTSTRDQYIHALFNKDYDDAMSQLPELAQKGLDLARELNNFSDRVETQMKNTSIIQA